MHNDLPTLLFAQDFGYGMQKMFGPSGVERSFRSTHGITYREELPGAMGVNTKKTAVKLDTGGFVVFGDYGENIVGKKAMRSIGGDRVDDPNFLNYIGAGIADEFHPDEYKLHFIYGLPVDDNENNHLKRRIVTALKRPDLWRLNPGASATNEQLASPVPFEFETPEGKYSVLIEAVTFMAQPMGTAWNMLVKENCALDSAYLDRLHQEKWMIIDLGSGTLDISTITNGQPTPGESGTVDGGMNFLVERLQEIIHTDPYNLPTYSRFILQQMLDRGVAPDPTQEGGFVDVSEAVERAKKELWDNLISFITANCGKAYEYSLIIVTGGGGAFLLNYIANYFNMGGSDNRVVLAQHPMFANVKGWYKYVKCVAGRK